MDYGSSTDNQFQFLTDISGMIFTNGNKSLKGNNLEIVRVSEQSSVTLTRQFTHSKR